MALRQNLELVLAATVHVLGFFLGALPGLIVWYASYDRSRFLMRHGLAAAKFQSVMFLFYVGLVSLYDKCNVTSKEIASLTNGSLSPVSQRPEAIIIAACCALGFALIWFANLVLSVRSTVAAACQRDPNYPTCPRDTPK